MNTRKSIHLYPYKMIAVFCVLLTFMLAACGASGSSSSGSSSNGSSAGQTPTVGVTPTTPASSPTKVAGSGSGTAEGCPSQTTVNTTPAPASVVITTRTAQATAHPGDVVEIRLPFGQKWSNPRTTQTSLTMQQPSGYASQQDKACVWRFTAKSAGTEQLAFTQQPICKPGMACPMHIAIITFTVTVK
jgi:hypothetical protein